MIKCILAAVIALAIATATYAGPPAPSGNDCGEQYHDGQTRDNDAYRSCKGLPH